MLPTETEGVLDQQVPSADKRSLHGALLLGRLEEYVLVDSWLSPAKGSEVFPRLRRNWAVS